MDAHLESVSTASSGGQHADGQRSVPPPETGGSTPAEIDPAKRPQSEAGSVQHRTHGDSPYAAVTQARRQAPHSRGSTRSTDPGHAETPLDGDRPASAPARGHSCPSKDMDGHGTASHSDHHHPQRSGTETQLSLGPTSWAITHQACWRWSSTGLAANEVPLVNPTSGGFT